jgi:hypothetical protein
MISAAECIRRLSYLPSCTSIVDEDSQTVSLLLDLGHQIIAALLVLQIRNNLLQRISISVVRQ